MSNSKPPFDAYHRRALGSLAQHIQTAQVERETAEVLRRARCPLCPPPAGCTGNCAQGRKCDCQVGMSEQPASRVQTWLAEESNAMAAMLPPTLWQRIRTRLRLFVDGWIDPTVRG